MNRKKSSFYDANKIDGDFDHFDILPDDKKADIENNIISVINESFIKTADEDYITARFLAQKGMHRAFFWAAAQTMEKYLKAFLLMRGYKVKNLKGNKHSIVVLHKRALNVDNCPLSIDDVKPHEAIKFHSDVYIRPHISVDNFVENINEFGDANNRYNRFGIEFNYGYLFALDSYVFHLRKQIGLIKIDEFLNKNLNKMDQFFVETFYAYNPWFAFESMDYLELPNENFTLRSSGSCTRYETLIGCSSIESKTALLWLENRMVLPKDYQKKQY